MLGELRAKLGLKIKAFVTIVFLFWMNSIYAASNVDPKQYLGWIEFLVVAIIGITSLISVIKGIQLWQDDASKGKMAFIGGILGFVIAGIIIYVWGKVFPNSTLDIVTSL